MQIQHTHLATTHSTNSLLIDWITQSFKVNKHQPFALSLSKGEKAGLNQPHFSRPHLLTTDTQTSGRGQHGRQWQSPLGNVYLSLYIPTATFAIDTDCHLRQRLDGRLSLCVGYQLTQIAEIKSLQKIGVKWVNDIGFYTPTVSHGSTLRFTTSCETVFLTPRTETLTFNKLAGILIEPVSVDNKMLGVVVGVGMNIAFAPTLTATAQQGLNYQAVSLQTLIGESLDYQDFYQPITQAVMRAIQQFNGFNQPSNVAEFLQNFNQADILLGKNLQITLADNQDLIGTAQGVDENGCLQILQHDGTITPIWTGTVRVLG